MPGTSLMIWVQRFPLKPPILCLNEMILPAPLPLAEAISLAAPAAGLGVAAAAGALCYGIFHPRAQLLGPLVYRGPAGAKGVALTFDDGPTPGSTDRVLDALGDAGVKAAFFVIGRNAERWPTLVQRMDNEGHIVANHTFEHSHTGLWGLWRYWREEITRANDTIEQIIGKRPALFRPPMGYKTSHVLRQARRQGQTVVTWSGRARDTKPISAAEIVQKLVEFRRDGDILLLHDGIEPSAPPRDTSPTVAAIPPLVTALREKSLEPVRLDLLLGVEAYLSPQEKISH